MNKKNKNKKVDNEIKIIFKPQEMINIDEMANLKGGVAGHECDNGVWITACDELS